MDDTLNQIKQAFSNVAQLTMAHMNYTWKEIEACTSMFTALRILSVPFNQVHTVEIPITNSPLLRLEALTLEGNSINKWEDVLKLGYIEW